jgi:hypothetical protein
MEKQILEEINKFKLLSNYDNNKTLNENYSSIISEDGIAKNVLKVGQEAKAAKSAISADKALLKGVTSTEGKILKSADDILNALKADKIVGKELARVNRTLFNSTETSLKLKNAIAKDIALTDDFAKLYGNLKEKDAIQKLVTKKGYTVEQANMITSQYKKNGKSFGKLTKDGSNVDRGIKNKNKNTATGGNSSVTNTIVFEKNGTIRNNGDVVGQIGKSREYKCVTRPNCKKQIKIDGPPPTQTVDDLTKMRDSLRQVAIKALTPGFNWKRLLKWAAGLGIGAGLLWWYFSTSDEKVPDDMPVTPPSPDDTDNGGDGNVYTTPGDPYQYKVVDCVWFTKSLEQRGKIISDWTSLANNQKAIDILDGRFPDARKNCGGNSSTNTNTNTNTDNNTLTPSGTTLNQQYGTEPMANAQAEVQTTNDDINNY